MDMLHTMRCVTNFFFSYGMALPGKSSAMLRKIVNTLVSITCQGKPVSDLYGCVSDGLVCSGHGSCNNHQCTCDKYHEGTYCETSKTDSSFSDMGIIIGVPLGISSPPNTLRLLLTVLLFIRRITSDYHCDDICIGVHNSTEKEG